MDVDVIFETSGRDPFTMKVDVYLDTVPKIKAKIYKLLEIPISQQTLIFQGKILSDDYDILLSNIYNKSTIHLLVAPPTASLNADVALNLLIAMIDKLLITAEKEFPPIIYRCSAKQIVIPLTTQFKFVPIKELQFVKAMTGDDQQPAAPAGSGVRVGASSFSSNLIVNANGGQNPPADLDSNSNPRGNKRRRVNGDEALMVVVDFRGERTPVAVNRDDRVVTLRYRLLQMGVRPPDGPYFFVYRQDTMEEDQTFRWHRVAQGDEISMFAGYVERGSP